MDHKKHATVFSIITLVFLDWFLQLLHHWKQELIVNNHITFTHLLASWCHNCDMSNLMKAYSTELHVKMLAVFVLFLVLRSSLKLDILYVLCRVFIPVSKGANLMKISQVENKAARFCSVQWQQLIYTCVLQKGGTLFLAITLPHANRFSKFFHC